MALRCLTEVVGDGFFAQDVLAGFERGRCQLIVRVRRGDDVDDVDVWPADELLPVVGHLGDVGRPFLSAFFNHIADGDDFAARVTLPARYVHRARPRPRSQNSYSQLARHSLLATGLGCG
jgi:hypothetical protein